MDLPLNTLLTVNLGDSVTVFKGLNKWLKETGNEVLCAFINDVFVPDKTQKAEKWETTKADNAAYVGKWPLRMHKSWRANGGTPLDKTFLSTLGEKVRAENPPGQAFIEISQDIEWKAGDFGDTGSCWFQENHESFAFRKRFLASGYGYAFKTYATAEAYAANRNKGSGRAWVAEYNGVFYMWNGRGQATEAHAKNFAALLGPGWTKKQFAFIPEGSYVDGYTYIIYHGDPPALEPGKRFTLPFPKAEAKGK